MSIEDRLFTLAAQARQQRGEAILHSPGDLTSLLVAQAPDLFGEIKALSDALAADAGRRIAAAPNPDEEANRIATEIAGRERLSMAVVQPAIAVARRLGGGAMPPSGGGGTGNWAGDSMVPGALTAPPPGQPAPPPAGYPPQAGYTPPGGYPPQGPTPPPAAEPFYKNKIVIAGAAAVAAFLLYSQFKPHVAPEGTAGPQPAGPGYGPVNPQQPGQPAGPNQPGQPGPSQPGPDQPIPNQPGPNPGQQGPAQGPGGQGPGQQGPAAQSGGPPELVAPGGQLPMLPVQQASNGVYVVTFSVEAGHVPVLGFVALPRGGWENGKGAAGFTRPGQQSQDLDTLGDITFQRGANGQLPIRVGVPTWDHDRLQIGNICVGFQGAGGQDVNPAGATMCVLDSSCQRPIGCGKVGGQ